jgi:hypothetical protein
MTFVGMQHMPLSNAYLCGDCNCVGNCAEQCPACASGSLMCLAGVLDREMPAEAQQVNIAHVHSRSSGASIAA